MSALTPKLLRDLALLRTIHRGARMNLSLAETLAGTGIPLSRARRVIDEPSPKPKPTQGKKP